MKQKPAPISLPPWTVEDTFAAYRDGWGLFQQDDGKIAIQRLDDPGAAPEAAKVVETEPVFDCDEIAVIHVQAEARKGNSLAQRALAFMEASNVVVPWA